MTVNRGAARRLGRDVLTGLIGFGAVFVLVYSVGKAVEPADPRAALAGDNVAIGIGLTEEPGTDPNLLEDLGAQLAGLDEPVAAIVAVSGALEERLVFNDARLRGWGVSDALHDPETGKPNLDPEGPVNLSIKYSGRSGGLALALTEVSVGEPKTDRMDVILNIGPKSWYTHAGDCTLELVSFDWIVKSVAVPVQPGHSPVIETLSPAFAGVVSCDEVAEVRSDEIASFSAVFTFAPTED